MDVYVVTYGSKWGWKYESGIVQKLCNTKQDAIELAKNQSEGAGWHGMRFYLRNNIHQWPTWLP